MDTPDAGDLVDYDGGKYRVNGWIREVPPFVPEPGSIADEILAEIIAEENAAGVTRSPRMQFCTREEATHLALGGVCGAIAPIGDCIVTGRLDWFKEDLESHRRRAQELGARHQVIY